MENSEEIKEKANIYKMTLLFTQTRFLHETYNANMVLSPFTFYLVDKKWLDNYKQKNNYEKIAQKLKESTGYNDYFSIKEKLLKEFNEDKNILITKDVENITDNFISHEKQILEKYQLNVPKNIELVSEHFIIDCLNNSTQLGFTKAEVFMGNETILIIDKENNNILYCCSLEQNKEDDYNFCVKVEYILFFKDKDVENDQIYEMANLKGLNNYLTKLNIDKNKKEEQEIKDKNGTIIGKFLKSEEEKNNNDIFNQEINAVNNSSISNSNFQQNQNQINEGNIQNDNINNSNQNNQKNQESNEKPNNNNDCLMNSFSNIKNNNINNNKNSKNPMIININNNSNDNKNNNIDNNYKSLILNNINSKPLIIERIFPYTLSRPNILLLLISKDKNLAKKLNDIFSKVSANKSGLDKEFIDNLNKCSKLKEMTNKIVEKYNEINLNNTISYSRLKVPYNFSYINYILNEIKKSLNYNLDIIDEHNIKGLIFDYLSTLDSIILNFLPQKQYYLDGDYIMNITNQNKKSKEKNKINQKIKLLLLFDENYFFNNIYYKIKIPNIEELEIIFDNKFKELYLKHNQSLHIYLNNYLSKIEYLDKITKIYFHNIENKKDLYQSVLGYLFDGYYFESNEDIKQQLLLMTNLKSVNIEMTFLYIYEKIKLYFYIYELFPLLNIFSRNKKIFLEVNFSYHLSNKILIINNSNAVLKAEIFYNFIDYMMNNENIEFIFIINHNKLIFDNNADKEKKDKSDHKIKLSKIKEFTFINEKNYDIKNLINKFIFNEEETYYLYEGYDINNNLIYFREGEKYIESFDLIDLFKNNEILQRIELIKENIEVKYNIERTHLQILYKGSTKVDSILNGIYFMPIKVFSNFIKYQNNLIELRINKFDFSFQDIVNDNVQILYINYEKEASTLEYKNNNPKDKLNLFPNLEILNLGSEEKYVNSFKKDEIPKNFKRANIILKSCNKRDFISKLKNKFKKYKKELNIEIIGANNLSNEKKKDKGYEEEYEDEDEEEYYEEEDFYEINDYL